MKRFALISALMFFTALPVAAQPIESEVLPPVAGAPQPSANAPAPSTAPAKPKNNSGYLPMDSATPADAPSPPIGDTTPKDMMTTNSTVSSGDDSGMAGTSGGGTSAYDLGAPTSAPPQDITPQDITPSAPPATNAHADPLLNETTPIRNWQENMDKTTRPDDPELANKKFCNLKVSFTSIGAGIDNKTADKIKMYLVANPDILTYSEHRWGKEGEFDYCVDIKEHKNRAKVYTDLKRNLPTKSSNAPPTNIVGDGFEPVSTYR